MQRVVEVSRQWFVASVLLSIMSVLALLMWEVYTIEPTVSAAPVTILAPIDDTNQQEIDPLFAIPVDSQLGDPASLEPIPIPSPTPSQQTYVIQSGDNLYNIALQYGTTIDAIVALNNMANPDDLDVGQTIKIPNAQ